MNGMLTANLPAFRQMVIPYLLRALVMLIAIPAHELAHAWVSWKLGDDTAKRYGRLTMNPMAHFEPMGALCMVLFGVGWAKPVPTNVRRFKNPRLGMALTASAGPAMNLLLAYLSMIDYKLVFYLTSGNGLWELVTQFLLMMIRLNVALAVFNLLPIPPFDGSRMLLVLLPPKYYFGIMKYERYIMMGMVAILWLGLLNGVLATLNFHAVTLLHLGTGFVEKLLHIRM